MTMIRLLIGSVISFGALSLVAIMSGAHAPLFFYPYNAIVLLLAPAGLAISSFGVNRSYRVLLCVVGFEKPGATDRVVLKRWISFTYAVGWIVFMGGVIVTLTVMDQGIMVIGTRFSAAITAPMGAVVISEFFFRTALNRIEDASGEGSQ